MKSIWKQPIIVFLVAIFCCFLWGSAPPFIKLGYQFFSISSQDTASILLFAGLRFFLAGVFVLLYVALFHKRHERIQVKTLFPIGILALCQTVGQYYFYYIGLAHTTGVNGAIITGLGAFISLLVACLIFRYEKLTGWKCFGCLCGFVGIVWMNQQGMQSTQSFAWLGEGFVLLSQVCADLSAGFIKYFSKKHDPVYLSGCQFLLGGFILMIIAYSSGGRLSFHSLDAVLNIAYLALVSALAYTLWGILLSHNTMSKIGIFNCLIPIVGVLLSGIFLHEMQQVLQWNTFISLAFISLGIYCVMKE